MQPRDEGYVDLDDGRKLCLECLDSVIMDTKECQPLYYNVLKFYKHLGMNIEQEIPMLLVERQALNAARDGEKDVSWAQKTRRNRQLHSKFPFLQCLTCPPLLSESASRFCFQMSVRESLLCSERPHYFAGPSPYS